MVTRTNRRGRQHGAAILLALLIMTLVATLAAGMVWLQWRGIEVETAERARTQADWLLNASLDWGNLILRTQARSNGPNQEDDLGQPWATPLAETKLSSFLSADGNHSDDGGPEAYLSGQITDAESKYNLYNILIESSVPLKPGAKPEEINRLRILCNAIGVPPDTANAIGAALLESQSSQQSAADGVQGNATGPLMPIQVDDLVWLGIDPAIVRQLKPFVQILPPPLPAAGNASASMTTINANTAPAEVLMAALPGITLPQAQQIVLARRVAPFKVAGDVLKAFGGNYQPPPGPPPLYMVSSSHFEIYGQLRYEQNLIRMRSVVYRQNQFSPIQVLRRERIPPDAT